MKVTDIKNLPKKFNFKSNINPFGIIYCAEETKHGYKVTCSTNERGWEFTKAELRRNIFNGNYMICS